MFFCFCLLQFIWSCIAPTFYATCPSKLRNALRYNLRTTRVSVNLINKGLAEHVDNVVPKQPDAYKSVPGISVSVHLGAKDDTVFLKFSHEGFLRHMDPGTMVLFPGYALTHKTVRPADQSTQRRYSLVLFFVFKKEREKEMDKYIHDSFAGKTNDTYPRC